VPGLRCLMFVAIAVWLGVAVPWPSRAQPVTPVEVVRARLTPVVVEIPLTGTVTARDHASLSSRVSGLVSAVHVTAGDRVDKGALLLSLDPTLETLGLMEAKAASAEGRAILDEAQRRRDEARRLGPRKGISESEIRAAEAEVKVAQAKLARLHAAERYRQELVARHEVYAPFAGVVARRFAAEGEWVNTGTPVLELVGTKNLRLDLRVPQEHYPYIDTDTGVSVRLDATPSRSIDGRISAKVPLSDASSRTFLLRVQLVDGTQGVTPGMSAQARLRIPGTERVLTVPRDAILRDAYGASRIWALEDVDGAPVATQRTVQVGRSFDGNTELRDGLEPGARVVVRGNETLREGQPVRVVNSTLRAD
jgi:membrane fusion protein, multidrug efflux system